MADELVVDEITLICSGCRSERVVELPEPLRGSAAVIHWLETGPTPCGCGAKTCDVKCRLRAQH